MKGNKVIAHCKNNFYYIYFISNKAYKYPMYYHYVISPNTFLFSAAQQNVLCYDYQNVAQHTEFPLKLTRLVEGEDAGMM